MTPGPGSCSIALSLTEDYAPSWGMWEGVRELVQNWHDGLLEHAELASSIVWKQNDLGDGSCRVDAMAADVHLGTIIYCAASERLTVINRNVGLARRTLLLGSSQKAQSGETIGQFGEGMKVGNLALLREGRSLEMATRDEHWVWSRKLNPAFGVRVLTVDVAPRQLVVEGDADDEDFLAATAMPRLGAEDTCSVLQPLLRAEWTEFSARFLFLSPPQDAFRCELGDLILDESKRGQLYVKGVWVASMLEQGVSAGLNFKHMRLDRDRRAIVKHDDLESQAAAMWVRAASSRPPLASRLYELLALPETPADVRRVPEFLGDERKPLLQSLVDEFTSALGPDAVPVAPGEAGAASASFAEIERQLHRRVVVVSPALLALLQRSGDLPTIAQLEQQLKQGASVRAAAATAKPVAWAALREDERQVLRRAADWLRCTGLDATFEVGLIDVVEAEIEATDDLLGGPTGPSGGDGKSRRVRIARSALDVQQAHARLSDCDGGAVREAIVFRHLARSRVGSAADMLTADMPASDVMALMAGARSLTEADACERAVALLGGLAARGEAGVATQVSVELGPETARRELLLRAELGRQEEATAAQQVAHAADVAQLHDKMRSLGSQLDSFDVERANIEQAAEARVTHQRQKVETELAEQAGRIATLQEELREARTRATAAEERAQRERNAHARSEMTAAAQLAECRSRLLARTEQLLAFDDDGERSREHVIAEVVGSLKEEREARLCCVCLTAQRSVLLTPCRHVVLCGSCAEHVTSGSNPRCPLCRVGIEATTRVFM